MADIFNTQKRSDIMRNVHSKNNKTTEMRLIKIFQKYNIKGWRRNYKIKGHPDFVFLKVKLAIFVDGCFWHGHDCRNTRPTDNADYWNLKRTKNIKHDIEVTNYLEKHGWLVLRIWECELKKNNEENIVNIILEKIEGNK